MYVLLTGSLPFTGYSNENIMEKVLTKPVSYSGSIWMRISKEAISLVRKMLVYNPKMRINAAKALNDPWFKIIKDDHGVDNNEIIDCLSTLKKFHVNSTMERAVLSFIASHIINKNEEEKLRNIFKMLDKNNNGTLSVQEITEGYKLLHKGNENLAKVQAELIVGRIDSNKNSEIDYNGNFIL